MPSRRKSQLTPYEWLEYDQKSREKCSFFTQKFHNPPWPFRWHYHADHYEILLHLQNQGRFLVADAAGDLLEGDLYVLGPGLPHSFYHVFDNNLPARCCTVRFPASQLERLGGEFPELTVFRQLAQRAGCGIRYSAQECQPARILVEKMVACGNRPSVQAFSLFIQLLDFFLLNRGQSLAARAVRGTSPDGREDRLNLICQYLSEQIASAVKLEDVAREACMSVSALCLFFRKKTGRTVIQYINELRVARACELLSGGDRAIIDVAQDSGYANLSHFNRQFLRFKGCSPRKFRAAARSSADAKSPQ